MTVLPSDQFELSKYLGTWYQYASTSQWYEPCDAYNTQALYELQPDGSVSVQNTLYTRGSPRTIQGTLIATDSPRVFQVKLQNVVLWFSVTAPYVVRTVVVDETGGYKFAIVGTSLTESTGTFYILSRVQTPTCAEQTTLLQLLTDLGYDLRKIKYTPQVCGTETLVMWRRNSCIHGGLIFFIYKMKSS